MKKIIALLLSVTVSVAPVIASAAEPQVPLVATAKTAKEWAAILGPKSVTLALSECVQSVKTVDATTSVTLVNGTRFDLVKGTDGKPKSATMFDRKGNKLQTADAASAALQEKQTVPNYVARDDNYLAMKQMLKTALLQSIGNQCHALAVKKAAPPGKGKQGAHTNNYDCTYAQDGDDGDCDGGQNDGDQSAGGGGDAGGIGDMGDGGGMGAFGAFVSDFVNEDFAASQQAINDIARTQPRMPCAVVTAQCQQTCANLGTLMGTTCGAAAGVAALFTAGLATPIAAATVVMCAGLIFDGVERCRSGCNTPAVACTP